MARNDRDRRLRHARFQRHFRAEVRGTIARLEAAGIEPRFPVFVRRTWYRRAVLRPAWLLVRDGFRIDELAEALTVDGELFSGAFDERRGRFAWPDGGPAEPIHQRMLSTPGAGANVHTNTGLKLLAQLARVGVAGQDPYNLPPG
jgi:hypothetical protein